MININFQVRAEKFQDATKEYIQAKIERMSKLLGKYETVTLKIDPIANAKARNTKYKMEMTVKMPHAFVKVEGTGTNINKVFDLMLEPLNKKLTRYHSQDDRWSRTKEWKMRLESPEILPDTQHTSAPLEFEPQIIRSTYNDDKPLHPAEAVEKMELLGNNCFLFKNIENNRYAMVYKLSEGKYKLVQPEA